MQGRVFNNGDGTLSYALTREGEIEKLSMLSGFSEASLRARLASAKLSGRNISALITWKDPDARS